MTRPPVAAFQGQGARALPLEGGDGRLLRRGGERHPAPGFLAQAQRAVHPQHVARPVAVPVRADDGARAGAECGGQRLQVAPVPGAELMVPREAQPCREIGDPRPAGRVRGLAHAAEFRHLEQAGAGGLGDPGLDHGAQRVRPGQRLGRRRREEGEQQQQPSQHRVHSPNTGSAIAPVSTRALARSMKKAPVSGTTRKATGAGP